MCSSADPSPPPSQATAHGSRSMWIATPSSYRTCTDYSLPVSRRTAKESGHCRRDQVDATVVPNVRRQRGAASASCPRLQPRQFPAHAGDAGADQGLVAGELEGEVDQDRRESREPRPLCYLPDGRGRHARQMFQEILRLIAELRPQRETLDVMHFKSNRQKEYVQMPGKMARSDPR